MTDAEGRARDESGRSEGGCSAGAWSASGRACARGLAWPMEGVCHERGAMSEGVGVYAGTTGTMSCRLGLAGELARARGGRLMAPTLVLSGVMRGHDRRP